MPRYNIPDELDWIYHNLTTTPGVYLLEGILSHKDYSASTVHEWGATKEGKDLYEKIRDLIKVRTFEAVQDDELDKILASEILKTYYYAPFKDQAKDIDDATLTDGDMALLKRAGIYVD